MQPKTTILYYPSTRVPTTPWLRQVLLYWDEISSIVPHELEDNAFFPIPYDVQYLQGEGEFRPIHPEMLVRSQNDFDEFHEELVAAVTSERFQRILPPASVRQFDSPIHTDKVSDRAYGFLADRGLVKPARDRDEYSWLDFESTTAKLYMGLLAKYLADYDSRQYLPHLTVPGTDRQDYEDLVFQGLSPTKGFTCLAVSLRNGLPIPREDVALADIISFKRKRHDELRKFRQLIEEFHKSLSECQSNEAAYHVAVSFSEKVETGISDLEALMRGSKLATAVGSLKTIIGLSLCFMGDGRCRFGTGGESD
jgi:hypothetical protein